MFVGFSFPLLGLFYDALFSHSVLLIYFSETTWGLLVQGMLWYFSQWDWKQIWMCSHLYIFLL